MRHNNVLKRIIGLVVAMGILINSGSIAVAKDMQDFYNQATQPETPIVVQVYYQDDVKLKNLASFLDIWEVDHESSYLTAMVSPGQYTELQHAGYSVVIDQAKTDLIRKPNQYLPDQSLDTIPGYPCYRSVEETYAALQSIITNYPDISELIDIGDSWDKITPGGPGGYDIYALRITNENLGLIGEKPTFFLMAEIHAREYVTAETALRFAEYLTSKYGIDPDITWLIDYFRIYIVTMTNPDGRKFAEQGQYWRKNTDTTSGGGCSFPYYGVDLNRNHGVHWGGAGTQACDETYQGESPVSEPEAKAIQDFAGTLFPDQRGPADTDPAPVETTGTFITLHSYSKLVLWPWGWSYNPAPNNTQLQTLGRHLAYFNQYTPQQSTQLYPTTGTSDDWSYGELGVASYTFEMGTQFFQSCPSFENTIYPDNRDALLYAFKSARRPYINPAGPDTISLTVTPDSVPAGTTVQLSGIANDTRFNGGEASQHIDEARYTIDAPYWGGGITTFPLSATDGNFNNQIENISGEIDTSQLSMGRHTVFVESKDANGNWGVTSAVFLTIAEPPLPPVAKFTDNSPINLGQIMQFTNQTTGTLPITYLWDFGDGVGTSTNINPVYTYNFTGTFTVTLTATNTFGTDSDSRPVTVNQQVWFKNFFTLVFR